MTPRGGASGKAALVLVGALCACGPETVDVVGEYNDAAEVLSGTIVYDGWRDIGTLSLRGARTGLRCEGEIWATTPGDAASNCAGMNGDWSAFCDDGRRATGDWRARRCGAGVATGKDSRGEDLSFFFGADSEAAAAFTAAAQRRADLRPALPTARVHDAGDRAETPIAFYVSTDGAFITAAALLGGARQVSLQSTNSAIVDGRIIAVDTVNGLALGMTDRPAAALPMAATDAPGLGDAIIVLDPRAPIAGRTPRRSDDPRLIAFDAAIPASAIGAPVVDAAGGLIGVVTPAPRLADDRRPRETRPAIVRIAYAAALMDASGSVSARVNADAARFSAERLADAYAPALATLRVRETSAPRR